MQNIKFQRLHNQQLEHTTCQTPHNVVSWLGAVQAQEYHLAKWGLGLRLNGYKEADVEQAMTDGTILRTHAMRPTWHFVTPEDIRWLQMLTSPRVHTFNGFMYRKMELDSDVFVRSIDVMAKALQGGKQLTRVELSEVLARAGIEATHERLAHIVMYAELEALICSGARRGNQFTYALLDERAPQAKVLSYDEALAELTVRFYTGHGPATIHDFAWWSGLTIAEVKTGLEMVKSQIISADIDGKTYWYSPSLPIATTATPRAYLLPPYDEYGIAYRDHSDVLDPAHLEQAKGAIFGGIIVINGQVLGNWKRTLNKGKVLIEFSSYRPLAVSEKDAGVEAAQRFGEFVGLPVVMP